MKYLIATLIPVLRINASSSFVLKRQTSRALFFLIVFAFATRISSAQVNRRALPQMAAQGLELNDLLDRLEANIREYKQSVPNLFCTEYAEAKRTEAAAQPIAVPGQEFPSEPARSAVVRTKSKATFRLRRTAEVGTAGSFEELRALELIDGKPRASGSALLSAPVILYGVFSNGLNILSKEGRACFAFRLRNTQNGQPMLVDFADFPKKERAEGCPPFANTHGHISIDPVSLHVLHIAKSIPHMELIPSVYGLWEWTEDYAPVTLTGKVFWLPKRIRSRSMATDGTPFVWTLKVRTAIIIFFKHNRGLCRSTPLLRKSWVLSHILGVDRI